MQNLAFTMIGIGILIIIGYFTKEFFMAGEIPVLIRVVVGVVGAGALILIGVAIKDRLKKAKTEDFKGVEK